MEVRETMRGCFPESPTLLKVHEKRNILGLVDTSELPPLHIFSEICSRD